MINAIDLSKLRNAEFLQFGATLSGLVDANDPVVLHIAAQQTAFKTKLEETSGLFKFEKVMSVTQEIVSLDERRDKAIIGLTALINGYCNHFDTEISGAAELLFGNLNLYGLGVARLNTQAETSTIKGIVNDWESKSELTAAITKLGLTAWVAELKASNLLFEQKYIQRTQEYGAANPNTLKVKREETVGAYYELRKFIDAYSIVNPGPAYEKMINELNALINQYNELLASRPTKPAPEAIPAAN